MDFRTQNNLSNLQTWISGPTSPRDLRPKQGLMEARIRGIANRPTCQSRGVQKMFTAVQNSGGENSDPVTGMPDNVKLVLHCTGGDFLPQVMRQDTWSGLWGIGPWTRPFTFTFHFTFPTPNPHPLPARFSEPNTEMRMERTASHEGTIRTFCCASIVRLSRSSSLERMD